METPVCLADGHVYDKAGIQSWFARGNATSPLTNAALPHLGLLPLPALKSAIKEFRAWRDASEEEKEKYDMENVLLRCRNDTLESDYVARERERESLAANQRRLAEEYKELAIKKTMFEMEKAQMAEQKRLLDDRNADMLASKLRLLGEVATLAKNATQLDSEVAGLRENRQGLLYEVDCLEQQREGLRQRVCRLTKRTMEIRVANRNTLWRKLCDGDLDEADAEEMAREEEPALGGGDGSRRRADSTTLPVDDSGVVHTMDEKHAAKRRKLNK